MKIDDVLDRVNLIYATRKLGPDVAYRAPECRPVVRSDQVMALLEVFVDELTALEERVRVLEGAVADVGATYSNLSDDDGAFADRENF